MGMTPEGMVRRPRMMAKSEERKEFHWRGTAYVRPVGRGMNFGEGHKSFEELVGLEEGREYEIELTVRYRKLPGRG